MKKSYNPFKMLGSWLGVIIIGLYGVFMTVMSHFCFFGCNNPNNIPSYAKMLAFVNVIVYNIFQFFHQKLCINNSDCLNNVCSNVLKCDILRFSQPVELLVWIILGFLIGWVIHSLIRLSRR